MPLLALIITLKFVHTLTPYALPFWMLRDTFFFLGGGGEHSVILQQEQKLQVPCKRNISPDTFRELGVNNLLAKSVNMWSI